MSWLFIGLVRVCFAVVPLPGVVFLDHCNVTSADFIGLYDRVFCSIRIKATNGSFLGVPLLCRILPKRI